MINSKAIELNQIELPKFIGEYSMIPFNMKTLEGIPERFIDTVKQMLVGVPKIEGMAFFTIHGKRLKKGETLRRGGPHTDGNYEPYAMTFGGGGGWKIGENGPSIDSDLHARQYLSDKGGIILASNFHACNGWNGDYDEIPHVGGDCSHIDLGEHFELEPNKVYYGNNHFIHESLPMNGDTHRVFARITMPEDHEFSEVEK
jgi:hypothetical protein